MNYTPTPNTCLYNLFYIQYKEDLGVNDYFYYDLKYPVFYNVNNSYFQIEKSILDNLNRTVYSSVYTFKDGLEEEEEQINKINPNGIKNKLNYQVYSDYAVTFNKNHVLSFILSLKAYEGGNAMIYDDLYNYNIDLLTGKPLLLKDVFRKDVDYTKVVNDYIKYLISQNPEYYYPEPYVDIPESQAFYLTDQGIFVYFAIDEISPEESGIAKFFFSYVDFESYINPRFYCNIKNVEEFKRKGKQKPNPQQNPRYYY